MALIRIDLDDHALAEAMRLSRAKTKEEAVNLALREYVTGHQRASALEHYARQADGWDYEGWAQRQAAGEDPG